MKGEIVSRREARNRAIELALTKFYDSQGARNRNRAKFTWAVSWAIDEWEELAPPRGDGYSCQHACAHCCPQHACEDC